MTRAFHLVVIFSFFAVPCFAGQGTIQETDTQIIIEYWGGTDDVKAAEAHKAELQAQALEDKKNEELRKQQEEARAKLHAEKMARAVRNTAARGY